MVTIRQHFTADWAFGITGTIEKVVRKDFPQNLRNWPLLQSFDFEAYELPDQYMVFIFKDKLSGIVSGPGVAKPFPYSNHPALPPQIEEIELWQFYLRDKFNLRPEDTAFLIPIRDSGKNDASKDYDLFSPEERLFWHQQVTYEVLRYKAHLQSLNELEPQQPVHITYNDVSGSNARVNVNSADSSVNIVNTEAAEVFDQLRRELTHIEIEYERKEILQSINDMESAYGSNDFLAKYKDFVSLTADHISVFAPILPALTNLLT